MSSSRASRTPDFPVPAADAWRLTPHTYAATASRGRWRRYPHLDYIGARVLRSIVSGEGRLIVSMPPRHGKSAFLSKWLPVWFLDTWPERQVLLASYSDDLARTFGRRVRDEMRSNELVLSQVTPDSRAAMEFTTTDGGGMVTAGIGGSITGRGAHLAIVDDPIKNWIEARSAATRRKHREWFDSTLYTRLEPGATVILVMTRWHEEDLAGYLEAEHGDTWTVIRLPALAEAGDPLGREVDEPLFPERYPLERLLKIKAAVGSGVWPGLFQQRPAPDEGDVWKVTKFKRWTTRDELPAFDLVIQSWDANVVEGGSSFAVGQVWGRAEGLADRYLLDQVRGKWGFSELLEQFVGLSAKWPQAGRKLVENKANGPALQSELKRKVPGISLVEPEGGKLVRAMAVAPEIESENVWIPGDRRAYPWVDDFIAEAATFPNGRNDDQVDAASQALRYLARRTIFEGVIEREDKRGR